MLSATEILLASTGKRLAIEQGRLQKKKKKKKTNESGVESFN